MRKIHSNQFNLEMILSKHSSFENVKTWHQSHRLWSNMLTKTLDKTYKIHSNHLDSHPMITTKMRSILFDWLIEVKIIRIVENNRLILFSSQRFVKSISFIVKLIIYQLLISINIYPIQKILRKINFNYLESPRFL